MFLPPFSAFLLAAAGLVLAACGGPAGGARADAAAAAANAGPRATVVAGTGAVDAREVERVRATVEAELPELRALFDDKPQHAFFVYVHADRESLTPALAACLQPESPAFALLGQHQVHIVWNEMWRLGATLRGVVRHELVHELLDQYVSPHERVIPRWFHEGLAQHVAGDTYLGAREEDIAWLVLSERLPSFADLRDRFPSDVEHLRAAYAQSYSYVSWLVREYGLRDLLAVARTADERSPFESVLAWRLGRSTYELAEAWRYYVLHGSGAPWRVLFGQCFGLTMLALLPLLVVALIRRLARENRTAHEFAEADAREAALARERQLAAQAAQDAAAEAVHEQHGSGDADAREPGRPDAP